MPTNPLPPGGFARARHIALSITLSLLLAACNSDSGDSNTSDSTPADSSVSQSTATDQSVSITDGKVCSGAGNSGWCWQHPLPIGGPIDDYFFLDDKRGWAVGNVGAILSTVDGGANWKKQQSGTALPLSKIAFADINSGWAVSHSGTVLRTSNGGKTWQIAGTVIAQQVTELKIVDANSAAIVADRNVWVSNDGGNNWVKIKGPELTVEKYYPINSSNIWASVRNGSSGYFVHSNNGGISWETVALPASPAGMSRAVSEFYIIDANTIMVSAYESNTQNNSSIPRHIFIQSANGGKIWRTFEAPGKDTSRVKFVSANTGYVVTDYGHSLARTTDGGSSWNKVPVPVKDLFVFGIKSPPEEIRAYGNNLVMLMYGQAYLSDDGGVSWQPPMRYHQLDAPLGGIWFFSENEGLVTSNKGMLRTQDGGKTWLETPYENVSAELGKLQFLANGIGWAMANFGPIYRTKDKGKTWIAPSEKVIELLTYVAGYYFTDELNGWAVTPHPDIPKPSGAPAAAIYRTTDGGISWSGVAGTSDMKGLLSIQFVDNQNGIAVGENGIVYQTSNGGKNWQIRISGVSSQLNQVRFIDSNTAIAVGQFGTVVRSADRGATWTSLTLDSNRGFNDVRFVSAKVGWAVGDSGLVASTRDGGVTWSLQSTGSGESFGDYFTSAYFIDDQTGWIVGANGTIMATATGGR